MFCKNPKKWNTQRSCCELGGSDVEDLHVYIISETNGTSSHIFVFGGARWPGG